MRIMILAYDFPPLISIGGQRPYSWYKYLPDNEIEVTIVTRQWNAQTSSPVDFIRKTPSNSVIEKGDRGSAIIRSPFNPNLRDRILLRFGIQKFKLLRKILSYLYAFFEHLFFLFDSKSAIYVEAEKEIKRKRPDVIIVTGEPFILFKYGHRLALKHDIPWIADYRDRWTGNQGNYSLGPLKSLLNWFYSNREQKYLSNAFLITTAAPSYATALKKIHPDKEIEVIYNGYDDADFGNLEIIQPPSGKFVITYGGTIYPHQNLEMFLDGLLGFINQNQISSEELQVHFYGVDIFPEAKTRLLGYKKELAGYIHVDSRIPYVDLIKKMRASHLLLLLSRNGADWLNAKIFDYMVVKRPVLLVENDHGILESILHETNGGVSLESKEEVSNYLKLQYDNFKKGWVRDSEVNEHLLRYSRKYQAHVLKALLLNKLHYK